MLVARAGKCSAVAWLRARSGGVARSVSSADGEARTLAWSDDVSAVMSQIGRGESHVMRNRAGPSSVILCRRRKRVLEVLECASSGRS